VRHLCDAVIRDSNSILTVSSMLHGQYGVEDVCVSIPFVVGSTGIKRSMDAPLTKKEQEGFVASANSIKGIIKSLNI